MAIIWQKQNGSCHYKVTSAGASVRLYTNGVFHSQFNANNPVGGNLWDLLFLPIFMRQEPTKVRRVLVLGVGGGAVIRQINSFFSPEIIVGVDLDPVHLQVARRFFKVEQDNVELVHAEASAWLRSYRGQKFDLIIEDLFTEREMTSGKVEPTRAIAADRDWLSLLSRRLNKRGVLAMNFESISGLKHSAWRHFVGTGKDFETALRLSNSAYENVVGVFLREAQSRQQFTSNLRKVKALDQRQRSCKLQYRYRKI